MKTIKILLILLTVCFVNNTHAQKNKKIKISGYVKDSLNNPIANCVIFVDNIKQKKKTNRKGYYVLKLKRIPNKLMFYSNKHGITEIDYPNRSNIDITFKKMGIKSKNRFAEIEKNEQKNLSRHRFKDIYAYLRGRVSGVTVSPAPQNIIIIRGITSLKGSNEPLFVLNNMAVSKDHLETINPNDIKSVKVLKGAATTIYGVRGAAGVILITTY